MSSPTAALEAAVVGGRLLHGGHPVLAWQASNVAVQSDHAGNKKVSKAKSSERIDGIVALIMALGIHATSTAPAPEQSWDITVL
jgi:phage terminase large subunit-like protein